MRRIAITGAVTALLLAAASSPAGAATLAPTSANFGSHAVGTTSAPRAFTLTPELLDVLPLTIATTGDFKQTNNCGAALQFISGPCTINVTFGPTAAGSRTGTLSTTTLVTGGPTALLAGTGKASGSGNNPGAGTKKKCKKAKKKKKGKKKGKGKKKRAAASKKKKGKKKGKGKKKRKGCKKKKKKKKKRKRKKK